MKQSPFLSSRAGSFFVCAFLFLLLIVSVWADTDPKFYAVQASAQVQLSPPQITLLWAADSNATGYSVYRKAPSESSWGPGTSLASSATSYVDSSVSAGVAYEYQVSKTTSVGYPGFGYVCAGINAPLIESRGKVVLLVDNLFSVDLANELTGLQQDLVGDGWTVLRHDVSRTDSPQNIKSIIQSEYAADPANVRAVFLFGHIPVAYSGNLNPDGHPDHQGAWPTDAYYGDMDGSWTDNSVSNTSAARQANWNVPGDGKFDQSELPSDVELEVGRVDLANMTCFSNKTPARYEKDLLRQYLNKDHRFRFGMLAVQRRGLVCDNFGEKSGEAFAASGWRNFSAFFGANNVVGVPGWNYFSSVGSQSYLWSYGCGGGSYYTCDGIGSSDDFALTDTQTVFTMFLGSYFGDWDNESNFLRAPLGSTSSTLAVAWAGRPHWFFHHMGLGETIGYSARLSQNNQSGGLYSPQNYGTRGIHVALLGDPTLRMHPVVPPSGLNGSASSAGVALSWTGSTDSNLQGYHVYRSTDANTPFVRITGGDPIAQTSFTDPVGNSSYTYMVRALKLEQSGSGTYYNPSQGVFFGPNSTTSWGNSGGTPTVTPPSAPSSLVATAASASQVALSWTDTSQNESGFKIERRTQTSTYTQIGMVAANITSYTDTGLAAGTVYVYRVSSFNAAGSAPSSEVTATTPTVPTVPAAAVFLGSDAHDQGNWVGLYGLDGYNVVGTAANYPAYAAVNPTGKSDWTWASSPADSRALETADGLDRVAAAWYSASTFSVDVNLEDGQTHQVALYCLDWDSAARRQTIDILDASSGAILDSQAITDFNNGVYLVWNLTGHVLIRLTRNAGLNVVLNGIFLDEASPGLSPMAAPLITPNGGKFSQPVSVTLATTTVGAVIRYTVDGSEPTTASTKYTEPFTVSVSSLVKAKAFANGLAESATTSAAFTLNGISSGQAQALFVRTDNITQGSWKGVYGTEGYTILEDPTAPANYPAYVQVEPSGQESYVWSDTTSDPRALQESQGAARVAGCWFADPSFLADVNFVDGRTHRLTVYCLDWDTTARSQTIDLLDAATGSLLTSQSITAFNRGTYLVWDIKGHVQLRFTKTSGNNAVVMGLFFDPAAMQLGNKGSGTLSVGASVALSSSGFQLQVSGQVGEHFVIQASADLQHWEPIGDVTLQGPEANFIDVQAAKTAVRFYRALPASGTGG
jgi:hypothetical protein